MTAFPTAKAHALSVSASGTAAAMTPMASIATVTAGPEQRCDASTEQVEREGHVHPCPPRRREEHEEHERVGPARVAMHAVGDLPDVGDHDEVEEQLEPMHTTPAAHVDLGSLAHAVSLRPDVITGASVGRRASRQGSKELWARRRVDLEAGSC